MALLGDGWLSLYGCSTLTAMRMVVSGVPRPARVGHPCCPGRVIPLPHVAPNYREASSVKLLSNLLPVFAVV